MGDIAGEVFLLMRRNFRVSKNVRAKWYFQHLGKEICIEDETEFDGSKEIDQDLSVVSIVSNGPMGEHTKLQMQPDTVVTCLSRRYRLVFVLDLSPSSTTIGRGGPSVLYKNLYSCLERCLKSVSKPLILPGSRFVHTPEIFVSVIAFSPFMNGCSDQVLIQGVPLTLNSLQDCLESIHTRLNHFINKLALSVKNWMIFNHAKQRTKRVNRENDSITGNLFQLPPTSPYSTVTSPIDSNSEEEVEWTSDPPCDPAPTPSEWTLIALLRLGLVGVQLLPENTQSNIVVITDGEFCEPNGKVLQELLIQLRSLTVSCSFVQMKAGMSRNWGRVAYPALLQFLSEATFGAYVPDCSCSREDHSNPGLNTYHRHLLCWSFKSTLDQHAHLRNANPWADLQQKMSGCCLKKNLFSISYDTSLYNLLYIRLREGYTLDKVVFDAKIGGGERVELKLRLPWKTDVRVVYCISSTWPLPDKPLTRVQVSAEAYYEFIQDLSAERLKIKSPYRLSCINAFNATIVSLRESDDRLLHLHSFKLQEVYFTLPDSVRNGMPLFYLPPTSVEPVISSIDLQEKHPKFCQFWRPVCTLDINIWQKWLHTHVLRFILTPDLPLSPNLHQVSPSSGRYGSVQCRQAITLVHEALREFASFTLMEGHSYVKMAWQNTECTGAPEYFYIVRVCMRPPCLVVKVAFLGGRRGAERQHVMLGLRDLILSLKLKQKLSKSGELSIVPACMSLIKPIERVLVRYSSVPEDLCSIVRLATPRDDELARAVALHNTLARYFACRRCIWNLKRPNTTSSSLSVSNEAASYILQAIVRRRLNEGFRFASGSGGIICLIRELAMDNGRKCLIQYLLFPPVNSRNAIVSTNNRKESFASDVVGSESEKTECDSDAQLVTELWVEPQHGNIVGEDLDLMGCKHYSDIFQKIEAIDRKLVESLATFEHLNLGCNESVELNNRTARSIGKLSSPSPPAVFRSDASRCSEVGPGDSAITISDSVFCLSSLLKCCQQATLLFPALKHDEDETQQLLLDSLHRELNASHDIVFRPSSVDAVSLCRLVVERLDVTPGKSSTPWINGLRDILLANPNLKKSISLYCYCKRLNESRMELLAVPSSVKDLNIIVGSGAQHCTESSSSESLSGGETITEYVAHPREATLVIPIFVFDCYTPRITGLLTTVEFSEESLPANWHVYEDFTVTDQESVLANFHKTLQREGDRTSSYDSISVHLNAVSVPEVGLFRGRCRSLSITSPTLELMEINAAYDPNFSLRGYCGKIESHIFAKSFVNAVYTALVKNLAVHDDDVTEAIETRCEEFPLEIDLSEHLPVLCKHLSCYLERDPQSPEYVQSHPRCNTNETDRMSNFTITSQELLWNEDLPEEFQSPPCYEEHKSLLQAFINLVTKQFRPVPANSGLFFYRPERKSKESQDLVIGESAEDAWIDSNLGDLSSATTDFKDDQDDTVLFVDDSNKLRALSRNRGLSLSSHRSSTSLDSLCSSSTHGFNSEASPPYSTSNPTLPVFLQLTCSLRFNDKYVSCSVDQLPTCIVPLLKSANFFPEEGQDLKDLKIHLDLCVLAMSPFTAKVDLTQGLTVGSECASPTEGDVSFPSEEGDKCWPTVKPSLLSQMSCLDNREISPDLQRQIHTILEFPKPEMRAILSLYTGIECLMQEESIFRQTRNATKQLTEEQLDQVVTHLSKEATFIQVCVKNDNINENVLPMVTQIPFDFVMKEEASRNRLKELLNDRKVEYVTLSGFGPHFYACFVEDLTEFMLRSKITTEVVEEIPLGENPCSEPAHYQPQEIAHSSVQLQTQNPDEGKSPKKAAEIPPTESSLEALGPAYDAELKLDDDGLVIMTPRSQSFSGIPEQLKLQSARMTAVAGIKNVRWKSGTPESYGSLMNIHRRKFLENADPSWSPYAVSLSSAVSTDSQIFLPRSSALIQGHAGGTTTEGYVGEDCSMHLTLTAGRKVEEPRLILADFWLIVSLSDTFARVYFHEKEQGLHTQLFYSCVNIVRKLIERVNQEMLLQQLFETKKVDDLLIAPRLKMNSSKSHFIETTEYDEDDSPSDGLVPSAAHHFPGTFCCNMVWNWWIPLHCRLKSNSRMTGRVPGGLRDLLGKFACNRDNVYVFKETAPRNGVVYLRLHDSYQSCRQLNCKVLITSYQQQTGEVLEGDKEDKLLAKAFDKALLIAMHGVEEPGEELKTELKNLLQNRLDGEVLFALSLALTRHPNLRLTTDDVNFLQPDSTHPTTIRQFTFPPMAMTHLYAVDYYLRQHLSSIMQPPNYMNPTISSTANSPAQIVQKFRHYGRMHQTNHCEEGTSYVSSFYLYNREIIFKNSHLYSGRCGLACIHVSMVDHNGDFVGLLRSGDVDPQGCDKLFPHPHSCTESDQLIDGFKDLLRSSELVHKSSPSIVRRRMSRRGPPALLQVAVWERGVVSVTQLMQQVQQCLTLSLCDVITEFGLLSAPLMTSYLKLNSNMINSEPGSPTSSSGGEQCSISAHPQIVHDKEECETSQPIGHHDLRKRHSSAAILHQSTQSNPLNQTSSSVFSFDTLQGLVKKNSTNESPAATSTPNNKRNSEESSRVAEKRPRNKGKYLNPVFWGVGSCWLNLASGEGLDLKCASPPPAVRCFTLQLKCQSDIPALIQEITGHKTIGGIKSVPEVQFFRAKMGKISKRLKYQITDMQDINQMDWISPDSKMNIIIIGMSEMVAHESPHSSHDSSCDLGLDRISQRFRPLISNSVIGSLPRKKYFMANITPNKMCVQTYNWTQEIYKEFENMLLKSVCWFNAKSLLTRQIALHKMGIMHLGRKPSPQQLNSNSFLGMYWVEAETVHLLATPPNQLDTSVNSEINESNSKLLCPYYDYPGNVCNSENGSGPHLDVQRRLRTEFIELRRKLRGEIQEDVNLHNLHNCWLNLSDTFKMGRPVEVHIDNLNLQLLIERSRLEHFVYTPLLFAREWRKRIAHVRQPTPSNMPNATNMGRLGHKRGSASAPKLVTKRSSPSRSRHTSGSTGHEPAAAALSPKTLAKAATKRLMDNSDSWHLDIQTQLINTYSKYLHGLGFRDIIVRAGQSNSGTGEFLEDSDAAELFRHIKVVSEAWLQKTTAGGIILAKLFFVEPYFVLHIYVWESAPSRSIEFYNDWSWFISRTHMHSFSYDFHMRMVASYLTGLDASHVHFRQGYDMHAFLKDFLQYYQCRPAFARNCIYEDRLCMEVDVPNLFDYLLAHDKGYGLRVFRMRVPSASSDSESDPDYLLVSSEHFAHSSGHKYVTLNVIFNDSRASHHPTAVSKRPAAKHQPKTKKNVLMLKFYVIFVCIDETAGPVESEDVSSTADDTQINENNTLNEAIAKSFPIGNMVRMNSYSEGVLQPVSCKPAESDVDECSSEGEGTTSNSGIGSTEATVSASPSVSLTPRPTLSRRRAASGSDILQDHLTKGRFAVFKVNELPAFNRSESEEGTGVGQLPPPDVPMDLGPVKIERRGSAAASIEAMRIRQKLSIQRSAPRRHRKSKASWNNDDDCTLPSLLQRERVTWVAFVSGAQQQLQKALECQVTRFKTKLNRTVSEASWHCRRDKFWERLLTQSTCGESASNSVHSGSGIAQRKFKSTSATSPGLVEHQLCAELMSMFASPENQGLSSTEFDVLLSNVQVVPAEEVDPNVLPLFQNMSSAAALTLMKTIVFKYGPSKCRFIAGQSGTHPKQYLVISNPNNTYDTFFLVTADKSPSSGCQCKLSLVYKDLEQFSTFTENDKASYVCRKSFVKKFFEDVICTVAFHVWAKLVT